MEVEWIRLRIETVKGIERFERIQSEESKRPRKTVIVNPERRTEHRE